MKKLPTILVFWILLSQTSLFAALTPEALNGDAVVVDSTTDYVWYWDPGFFASKTYDAQVTAIAGLNAISYAGRTDWKMAKNGEILTLFGYGADHFGVFTQTYSYYDTANVEQKFIYARYGESGGNGFYATNTRISPSPSHIAGPAQLSYDDTARSFLGAWVVSVQANTAPDADAGPDQTVDEGEEVTLDGSGSSDDDDDPLTYSWTWGVDGSAEGVNPMVVFPLGTTEVMLVVNDGTEDSQSDTVNITVVAVPDDGCDDDDDKDGKKGGKKDKDDKKDKGGKRGGKRGGKKR